MTISSKLFATQMLDQFKVIENRLQSLNTQISTGTRITKSSDAPIDAVTLTARSELQSRIEQYQSNVGKVNERLGLADTTLETMGNLVTRMNEKFIATNTATVTDAERQAVRLEVLTFKDSLLGLANSIDNNGDALYGGFSTEGSPFVQNEEGQTRYRGDGGEHILQVSESVKLPTSLNGSSLFMEVKDGAGTKSSFDILDSFANALLTDSQFEQSYSANSADTAQSISYDLTNSSMVSMFDFDAGESQQNLAASTGIQPGEFTFTINDTPTTITITDGGNDTLQGLIDEINAISNVTANLVQEDSGLTLQITSTAGAENAFSISSSDAELVVLQTGVPASSSTSAQLTVVSEAADAVSGAMKLRINASREPQNWSMVLTGPEGSATVSADINSDSFTALVDAINASGTGLTATDNGDGTLSVSKTDPSSEADVVLEDISIEGYNLAQKAPRYYIDVLNADNEVALKISDQNQALSRQGTAIQSLLEHFALSRTIVGARINNADAQNTVLQDRSISIQTEISDLRDADIETLITELQTIMVTRDAARQTYSTINSQSLFDFLK
ncbi:MAG: flagellar hook-associated protein FlgL [Rhodobacteraceae bacterium]|nr:flagellar hook-associated protein FlgL [Paracoccaceae bacterium]